jgi:hypothetical protein
LKEADAARAHDRAALALIGPHARLNFPEECLRPASIATLRKEAASMRPRRASSKFNGVQRAPRSLGRCWLATIEVDYRSVKLGSWRTEREAALAYDRAALYLPGHRRTLNFPQASKKKGPASPEALRAEALRQFKQTTTSRYRGVYWAAREQLWHAEIRHERRRFRLGYFRDEVRAAEAYDEAARRLHEGRAKLNFP